MPPHDRKSESPFHFQFIYDSRTNNCMETGFTPTPAEPLRPLCVPMEEGNTFGNNARITVMLCLADRDPRNLEVINNK